MDAVVPIRDPIWYKKISILFEHKRPLEFWPHPMQSFSEKANAMVRFSIYAGVALYLMSKKPKYLVLAIVSIGVISFLYHRCERQEKLAIPVAPYPRKPSTRESTVDNPYANNLVGATSTVEGVVPDDEASLQQQDDNYKKRMFMSYEDVWDKHTGQRQFLTLPEHDPSAFADYLYKDLPCKRRCPQ